jgi:putative transposase
MCGTPGHRDARGGIGGKDLVLSAWPVDRPRRWTAAVNDPLGKDELEQLRISVNRGRPLGEESWVWSTARRLGLEFTPRGPGRPRKKRRNH